MNISWDVVWKYVKFLLPLFRPSIAKALSVPLMLAGIGILTPPWWLDMLVKLLRNQMGLPQDDGQTSTPMYTTGWALIGLSIVIYLIDVWRQVKSMNQDNEKKLQEIVKDYPEQTSNLTIEKFKSVGFIAPHLQDEKIDKLINEITLLRFFSTFPKEEKSSNLAESIIDGELSGGTPQAKARALALLARFLSVGEGVSLAKEWLSNSKRLCQTEESVIAQAFIDATGSNNIEAASGLLKVNSPSHYSAYFMIKRVVKGSNAALRWFEIAELSVQELDGDGKIALLSALLSERQWEKALDVAEAIDYESLSKFPALAQFTACTFLINAIKVIELRESVLINIPFAADRFPLADDTASIALRNRAVELFKICSDRAGHLGAEDVSSLADRYALWLELRNSETHERAMALLQSYFIKYSQKTLEYLPLAFVFGIDIDSESIENEVNRQSALSHDNDPILSLARFVLAHTKKSFPAMLKYIANHRPQIEKTVHPTAVGMFEIEALARSGLVDDAELLLQKIEASGATQDEVRSLKNIIESAKGEDPIALATSQYQQTKTTNDLSHLVDLLERENLGDKYYSYCRELFDRTGQESDAIRVCNAASSLGKFSEIHQFLSDRMEIVIRSEGLQAHWAWCLFRKGDINGARAQIALLKQSSSQQSNLRTLEINLSIFSGDWESLSFFIEGSWNRREELKAKELLQAAQLAKAVSPGRTRQILAFCTGKYSDDPQVLASSYFTATTMGWEDNQQTSEWLNKAMVLSNDDGPLHRASLEDLKEMMPENRDKNEKVYKAYFDGSAPIITVAELLNRTVSDFYLIQSLENKRAKDIRRKNLIAIFHGVRLDQVIAIETIAVDATSSLVLESLGLLAHLFDCFERIVIPHCFMHWLFEEKQKVTFHQPSQIEKAKYFERLVSDGRISVFHPKKINNPELALDVGDELAYMLEEALTSTTDESQALVVCSSPVYKVGGSFREEEVDLSSFHHGLITCSQLVKKLQLLAVITEAQCVKALNYLRQHEKDWPTSIDVKKGARLFLDSLSITYLMGVGMLDKLSDAGFEVYVFKGTRDTYRGLVNYDSIIEQANSKIENIRKLFSSGLTGGNVILAPMPPNGGPATGSKTNYARPTEEYLEMLKKCEGALIDDRFMNRHRNITFDEKTVPIFTSLDFIETLHYKGLISQEQKLDARASLRELGFEFVRISAEELEYHLNHSVLKDGEFNPTKQLRQIKENLLLIRISGLVQLPRDAQWLQETMKTITQAIKIQWSDGVPVELSRARSSWLYELTSYREWAHAHQIRGDQGMAYLGDVIRVNSLLIPPKSLSSEKKKNYKAWLDEIVLGPLKDFDPWSFKKVVDSVKQQVISISQQSISEDELDGKQ